MTVKKYDPIHFFEERGLHVGRFDQLLKDHVELQAKYKRLKILYDAMVRQKQALAEDFEKPTRH